MPVIFRFSDGIALKTDKFEITAQSLPDIIVCKHSSPWHPQMQVKSPSCKQETACERDPKRDPKHLEWTERKWKAVLWSEELKFEIPFCKSWTPHPLDQN